MDQMKKGSIHWDQYGGNLVFNNSHCPNRRYLMQIQDENTIITCIKGPKTVYIISRVGGEMLH